MKARLNGLPNTGSHQILATSEVSLLVALREKTAVQAVVGSIVWALRRLKKPSSREMSARGYALHSVCPQLSFLPFSNVRAVQDVGSG